LPELSWLPCISFPPFLDRQVKIQKARLSVLQKQLTEVLEEGRAHERRAAALDTEVKGCVACVTRTATLAHAGAVPGGLTDSGSTSFARDV
jgi:hypothetical protein